MKNKQGDNDRDLARRMRRGDTDALEQWFNLHADGLYAFIFFRVEKDPDLAAEITQETFTVALQQLEKFDHKRGPMLSWLCTLSRNCIRKTLREKNRTVSLVLWEAVDRSLYRVYSSLDGSLIAPDLLEAVETREMVSMVMSQMPEDYKQVLEAKYLKQMSLQEIAESRSASVDSVKGLIKRARTAFRQTFAALAATTPHLDQPGGIS